MFNRLRAMWKFYRDPLADRQDRLRVGQLAWQGGVERTQEELRRESHLSLTTSQIEGCKKEYEEWLESEEAVQKKLDYEEWLKKQE